MTRAADLIDEALAAGLLLSRAGGQLHVDSPLGQPLPEGLRARLQARKREILDYLAWCGRADQLLLECSRRLAVEYPRGCPLEDEEWRRAEAAVHDAYHSGDEGELRRALARYEDFASRRFHDYSGRER